jgi:hypothetical protein
MPKTDLVSLAAFLAIQYCHSKKLTIGREPKSDRGFQLVKGPDAVALLLICLLLGFGLSRFFKAYILIPTTTLLIAASILGRITGATLFSPSFLAEVVAAACLQMGYVLGYFAFNLASSRTRFEPTRSHRPPASYRSSHY